MHQSKMLHFVTISCILTFPVVFGEHFFIDDTIKIFGRSAPFSSKSDPVDRYNVEMYQFLVVPVRLTWYEAQVICKSYNSTLAILNNEEVLSAFSKASKQSFSADLEAWVGARGKDGTWAWDGLLGKHNLKDDECLVFQYGDKPTLTSAQCTSPKRTLCQKDLVSALKDQEVPRPSPKIVYNNREFILYTNPTMSFYAAAAFCSFKGRRLAIVDDINIAKLIAEMMIINRPSSDKVWTAGRYFDGDWRWLSTNEIIKDINLENIPSGQVFYRRYTKTTQNCVLLQEKLNDDPVYVANNCEKRLGFVCESIPPEERLFLARMQNTNGPVIINEKRTWEEAKDYCKRLKGDLLEIDDEATAQAVVDLLARSSLKPRHLWLGAKLIDKSWWWVAANKVVNLELFSWCYCKVIKYDECLSLEVHEDGNKLVVHGLPCDYEQTFICNLSGSSAVANKK